MKISPRTEFVLVLLGLTLALCALVALAVTSPEREVCTGYGVDPATGKFTLILMTCPDKP